MNEVNPPQNTKKLDHISVETKMKYAKFIY